MERSVCARWYPAACFSGGRGVVCLFLVSADVIYGIVQAAFAQREAALRRTRLLLPCPAPGRQPGISITL